MLAVGVLGSRCVDDIVVGSNEAEGEREDGGQGEREDDGGNERVAFELVSALALIFSHMMVFFVVVSVPDCGMETR